MERLDIAVIGSGPAGLSAALNAKIRNKNVVIYGPESGSRKVLISERVNNYLGFINVEGKKLMHSMIEHVASMDIPIVDEKIQTVYSMGDYFALELKSGQMVEAKSVVLATGLESNSAIKGEEEFLGRGVSYCATCDAALYTGKKVVVVGFNDEAIEEANFISEVAAETIFVNLLKKEVELNKNIKIISDRPLKVEGDKFAERLIFKDKLIEADGFFIIKDSKNPGQLVPGIELDGPHVVVNKDFETSIAGIFAAGDLIGRPYQVSKAVGEGHVAGLNVASFLNKK